MSGEKNVSDKDLLEDYYGDLSSEGNSYEYRPSDMDPGTFSARNDPKILVKQLKMQLLNVYERSIEQKNSETGETTTTKKILQIPGTKPLCNKQGVQEIVSYVENFINGHIVQSNFESIKDLNKYMLHVSQDVTMHFVCQRKTWGLNITQCDMLIGRINNFLEAFLRRALFNEERRGYGETYKENRNLNSSMNDEKGNVLQRFWGKTFGS